MRFLVIKAFIDKDTKKGYSVGSVYESEDSERIAFLVGEDYLEGEILPDKEQEGNEFPKHTGGGYYELSNGEKVKGKDEATAAEEEINQSQE
jgi:hypothetical protein